MPATATQQQSYTCPACYGLGTVGEAGPTDRYATGEMQYRGYYPTNLCSMCNGAGVWGVPHDYQPQPVEQPKPQVVKTVKDYDLGDYEDPRDRI
jgi:hypothetical protein